MKFISLLTTIVLGAANVAAQQIPTKEQQIAAATLPLPEAYRAEAAVQSISADRKITELRKGTNSMVCSIVRPGSKIFYVRCFEKDYQPLISREFQLRQELDENGKPADMDTVGAALGKEIESGRIKVPVRPSVGFQMRGPATAFDWNTNAPSAGIDRWEMIMIPNATGVSLSLPSKRPPNGGLWVMFQGTPLAHIMVEH